MAINITDHALLRLLQLSSPSFPVGAYAFSFGLEKAVEDKWINNPDELSLWIGDQLKFSLTAVDVPIILRLHQAFSFNDLQAVQYWNDYLLACRETAELRLSDTAPALALIRLLPELGVSPFRHESDPAFLSLFVQAAQQWSISAEQCALAYLWSWLENQIIAATKIMPLGQSRAQAILGELQADIPALVVRAQTLSDDEIGACLPALAIASARHETQYSRLFRS